MMDMSVPSSMGWFPLIPLTIYLAVIGLGIYTMILMIKALRLYIKNNS